MKLVILFLLGALFADRTWSMCQNVQVQDCPSCPFRFVQVCTPDTTGPSAPINTQPRPSAPSWDYYYQNRR